MITDTDVTKLTGEMKNTFLLKSDFSNFKEKVYGEFIRNTGLVTYAKHVQLIEVKDELSAQISRLAFFFGQIQHDVEDLKARMSRVEDNIRRILIVVEGLAAPLQDLRLEYAAVSVQTNRLNEWAGKVAEKVDVPFDY